MDGPGFFFLHSIASHGWHGIRGHSGIRAAGCVGPGKVVLLEIYGWVSNRGRGRYGSRVLELMLCNGSPLLRPRDPDCVSNIIAVSLSLELHGNYTRMEHAI